MNFYVLVEELKPNSKAVENQPVFTTGSLILSKPLRFQPREWHKHGEGPLHDLSGKKQGRFNPKHIKTFQSSPSPLNISCSLQNFLWSQKPQLGTSLEERCFFSVLVFSYPPFSLHNKSFYLMCSPEPRRQCEIRSSAIRNTLRTQTCSAFSHTFRGCLIVTSMSVSEWDPTEVSFRKWITLTFLTSFSLCLGNSVVSVMGRRCPCAVSA